MVTIINIGTTHGSITGVEVERDFDGITYNEVLNIVRELGSNGEVVGWCDVTEKYNHSKT